ncbi:AAA family ATPase [Calidithermus timidus]|jgi:chromosome segregation protein|uniref:AAA family ATPase n=1 Tax=Calidithermus timidus TaxID=307124 RepID=UPI000361BC37|nr:AAA family ATPase [Calidithermus timidus]
MRIEQITLQGFKSFGERTRLDFGPGITGVVGPNGSGKSNLVEALRWIVGARARELRGEEAQALLFHGSDGHAPMGFAEVELVLSRGRERLVISRRLDRDGNGDVRLSGQKATFKAVERALAGSGLARGGYAIIGQGEVGEVLQAGPEVLLAYLEEAAGLKAVTLATRTAQERLEAAMREMEGLQQKHAELKEILQTKAAQAEAARQARALSLQLLALKRGLVQARIQESQAEARKTQARIAELEAERGQLAERLEQLQGEKTRLQENLEQLGKAHTEALRRAEALQGERRLLSQEIAHLRDLEARLQREAEQLSAQVARLDSLPVPQPPQEANPDLEEILALEQRQGQLEARLGELRRELQQAQARYEAFLKAQASYEARLAAFRELQEQQQHLKAERARLEETLARLEARRRELEAQEQQLRAELDRVVQQEGSLGAELRASRSEVQRLEAYLQSGSDLAEGPRKARSAGIEGVLGVVADLLEVPQGLELALEIALGGRLQWVLTRDEQAAKRAVEYLKREGGRATFLPLSLLKTDSRPRGRSPSGPGKPGTPGRDWSQFPGVRGLARELVGFAHPEALPALLGETLILQSLEAALELARRHRDHPRLVTLEGELLEPSGAITGGRVQRGGQLLAQRRRLAEVRAEAEALAQQVQALSARSAELREQLRGLALGEIRRQEEAARVELRGVRLALERLGNPQPPEAPEAVAPPNTQLQTALAGELEGLRQGLARLREAQQAWIRHHEQLKAYQEAQENRRRADERLQAIGLELGELEQRRQGAAGRLEALEREAAALGLAALEASVQQSRQRLRSLAEEESRLLARINALLGELEQARISLARRESTQEALLLELAELPEGPAEEGSSRLLTRRLAETETALEALGAVNHLAEGEYQALAQEAEQLAAALAEAEAGVAKLEAELRLVEGEYRERLQAAYHRFRERFAEYAQALLGAEARVEHAPSGLHLVLQPLGKRTIDLGLLSMGERTMGALAFLFALAGTAEEGRGLPIAVLDEVDAPLDEANILRFTGFLRRFKGETQFILVTHQKRTMEACDALYGVTSERGLSRVYSIRREDALS